MRPVIGIGALTAMLILTGCVVPVKGADLAKTDLAVAWINCIKVKAILHRGDCMTFEDRWLTFVKPEPYPGVATEFADRRGAWGNRLAHNHYDNGDVVCAHMLERHGQRLRVTNTANGRSVVCRVEDRGPNRKFWPRREIDLTAVGSDAIGCDGMCTVTIERVAADGE